MDKETALAKIKKCLALAKSDNPNEAAAAMRQAQKLMESFGLRDVDVAMAEVGETRCAARTQSHAAWESMLAQAISNAFGVTHFFSKSFSHWIASGPSYKAEVIFVGVGSASEVASYAWNVLSRQCAKSRAAYIKKQPNRCKSSTLTARGDAFANGWVIGVRDKLQAFAGTAHQRELLQAYMKERHPDLKTFTPADRQTGRNVSENDLINGFRDARNAQLHHGVGSGPIAAQIGN